jgi:hypothetical protein
MPSFDSGSVFAFIQGCGVTDNGTRQVPGWGGRGVASVWSTPIAGGTPRPHMFVLFADLTTTKVKSFISVIQQAQVASGYQVIDSLSYEVVAVLGTLSAADLAQLRQPPERVVRVIDPDAADAKSQLKTFLDR